MPRESETLRCTRGPPLLALYGLKLDAIVPLQSRFVPDGRFMSNPGDTSSNATDQQPMLHQRMRSNLKAQLKLYLELRGLSAAALARKAGIPKQSLSGWTAGKRPADIEQVKRVADALGVSLDHLLFGSGVDSDAQRVTELDALLGDGWISGLFEVKFRRIKKGGQ